MLVVRKFCLISNYDSANIHSLAGTALHLLIQHEGFIHVDFSQLRYHNNSLFLSKVGIVLCDDRRLILNICPFLLRKDNQNSLSLWWQLRREPSAKGRYTTFQNSSSKVTGVLSLASRSPSPPFIMTKIITTTQCSVHIIY